MTKPVRTLLLPVLKCHLQGDLHGGRPIVRVEDFGEAGRSDLHQPLRQQNGCRVRETQERRMGNPLQLRDDGPVDLSPAMAMNIAPERRDAVEVPFPIDVDEEVALPPLDDQGLVRKPLLHLCKGVPEILVILFLQALFRDHGQLLQGERRNFLKVLVQ